MMRPSLTNVAYAAAALLIAGYAFVALQGPQGIPGLIEKRRLIHEYEQRNATRAREIEEKRARLERFRANQSDQEMEIKQQLKLVKPDEKVFILQDEGKKP